MLWIVGACLVVLLSVAATLNLSLRTRSIVVVAERFKEAERETELRWLVRHRDRLIMAAATLRTIASLALVLDILHLCEQWTASYVRQNLAAFFISFFVILLFGVAVPSGIARYAAGTVVAWALPALRVMYFVSAPLLATMDAVDGVVRRLVGAPPRTPDTDANEVEREMLDLLSEGTLQGAFDPQEQEMIQSVIHFHDTDVGAIMTPRTDIVAIEKQASLADAIELIAKEGHSRIPVFDETIDKVLGVLYAKDLLPIAARGDVDIATILRDVPFVPDSKPVGDLLQEFRERKVHMAIVLDEYGGTSGLVTIEDILEELVGEIVDEFEEVEESPIKRIDEYTIEVDARVRVDELNQQLAISLPEHEDYETIGGFVFSSMGRIPRAGERCRHQNVAISVVKAEPRRINRLRLHIEPEQKQERDNGSES